MSLSNAELDHYARQVIIAELGAGGQEKLLAGRVLLVGQSQQQTALYLKATGLGVQAHNEDGLDGTARPDLIAIAGATGLGAATLARLRDLGVPILWYAIKGTSIQHGLESRGQEQICPDLEREALASASPEQQDSALHAVAGADLATGCVALVAGWTETTTASEATDLA